MRNKLTSILLVIFFSLGSTPLAHATDLPVLTWERGKEHNITLGGNTAQNWQIIMHSQGGNDLTFNKSKPNNRGFIVFSINIPSDYPLGNYTIQTNKNTANATTVAGIHVVELSNYNLIQLPIKLFIILFVTIFLISSLSTARMKKYQQIQYLREIKEISLPNILMRVYNLRSASVESIRKSLFKFLITREGELLHKISPVAWAVLPLVSAGLGAYIGTATKLVEGITRVSVTLFILTAVIGIIDPYSGFMASAGFAFAQTVLGNILSIRTFMGLIAIGVAWVAPGIISSFYRQVIEKDGYVSGFSRFMPDIFASAIGSFTFIAGELLTNSFTNRIGSFGNDYFYLPLLVGLIIFGRIKLEKFLFRNIHIGGDNYQVRTLTLPRVISPRTVLFAWLYFVGVLYVWTQKIALTLVCATLLSTPLASLLVRFERPKANYLSKFKRNIVLESGLLCLIAFAVFMQIQNLPFDVNKKGQYMILVSALILIVHAIYSSICDSSNRFEEVSV